MLNNSSKQTTTVSNCCKRKGKQSSPSVLLIMLLVMSYPCSSTTFFKIATKPIATVPPPLSSRSTHSSRSSIRPVMDLLPTTVVQSSSATQLDVQQQKTSTTAAVIPPDDCDDDHQIIISPTPRSIILTIQKLWQKVRLDIMRSLFFYDYDDDDDNNNNKTNKSGGSSINSGVKRKERRRRPTTTTITKRRWFEDTWFGITHLIKNYSSIWLLSNLGVNVVYEPLERFLRYTFYHYPSQYRWFRPILLRIVTISYDVSETVECIFQRIVAVVGIPIVLFTEIISHLITGCDGGGGDYDRVVSNIERIIYPCFQAPIIEEVFYRWLFHHSWMVASRTCTRMKKFCHSLIQRIRNKNGTATIATASNTATSNPEKSLETMTSSNETKSSVQYMIGGQEPWVWISSILFGASHLSNWMPFHLGSWSEVRSFFLRLKTRRRLTKSHSTTAVTTLGPLLEEDKNLCHGVYQTQNAFVLAMVCLVPLYQHRSVWASIGAHCGWNIIAVFLSNRCEYLLIALSCLFQSFGRITSIADSTSSSSTDLFVQQQQQQQQQGGRGGSFEE